jgi:hypothetical protein
MAKFGFNNWGSEFIPAPTAMLLVDSVRKGEIFHDWIISGSSPNTNSRRMLSERACC